MSSVALLPGDRAVLELFQQRGPLRIAEVATALEVTATAVRQRLQRLLGEGLVERALHRQARGRPVHAYSLTEKARRQVDTNYADLALSLWQELAHIPSPELRQRILENVAGKLAADYAGPIRHPTLLGRLEAVRLLFRERGLNWTVDRRGKLPVLSTSSCPYPGLAESDRGICNLEEMLLTKLLEQPVSLSECRLDGQSCCRFEVQPQRAAVTTPPLHGTPLTPAVATAPTESA